MEYFKDNDEVSCERPIDTSHADIKSLKSKLEMQSDKLNKYKRKIKK